MKLLFDVVKVEIRKNNILLLKFKNGKKRKFDMSSLLKEKPFVKLKDSPLFFKASVKYGTVV